MDKCKPRKLKRFNVDAKQVFCVGVFLFFFSFSIFRFPYVWGRLLAAVKNFCVSFAYYWAESFGDAPFDVTVNELPTIAGSYVGFTFPFEWSSFWTKVLAFFQLSFNGKTIVDAWTIFTEEFLPAITPFLTILLWLFLVAYLLYCIFTSGRNLKHGRETAPLKKWHRFSENVLDKVRVWFLSWREHFSLKSYWKDAFLAVWLFNFNIFAVFVDFFSWVFYFGAAFDFLNIYFQVYKLMLDLFDMFLFVPGIVWVYLILRRLNKKRFELADRRVRVMELDDRDFVANCPIIVMICAEPGAGKTTMMVSMGREQQYRFREKAFEIMMSCDLKFPNFPWICFEDALKKTMYNHTVYNLFTARQYVYALAQQFYAHPSELCLFGYNYRHHGAIYNDGLNVRNLFEILDDYARAFFIYMVQSSLIFSNFSAASDDIFDDGGNLGRWNMDYFSRDPVYRDVYRKFAHVLDFDFIRFGKLVANNPKYSNMFEFGIILVTEGGKERGNTLENKEIQKDADEANQKNDLMNDYLKMCRHLATIDGFPFVVFYCDEQRPESWGADARDLCRLIRVQKQEKSKLAIPFFHLEESILQAIVDRHVEVYGKDYRYRRGDMGLLMYMLHNVGAATKKKLSKLYGRYGYKKQIVTTERGSLDGSIEEHVYWLPHKIVYDDAFATDCFADIFAHRVSVAEVGIDEVPTFRGKIASIMEMSKMNSYFYKKLTQRFVA